MSKMFRMKFLTVEYVSDEEKTEHMALMIADGWHIDWQNEVYVCYKRTEEVLA